MSDLQQWQPFSRRELVLPNIEHLTVATLNVWFADDYFDQRCSATLALLQRYHPHVITLQEVTPAFLTQLLHTPWVQADYRLSDIYGESVDPYGVLILSRLPIVDWQFFALPSAMGRHLVTAHAALNQATTVFASVHLESGSYAAPIWSCELFCLAAMTSLTPICRRTRRWS